METSDCAISSKKIPDSNWSLVFTRLGKYFFYNPKNGERCWLPPERVLTLLKEKFVTSTRREMFFDPFYEGEELEESEEEESREYGDENDLVHGQSINSKRSHENSEVEDQFKLYLLKNNVDPFSPWPKILSIHSSSPEFLAIPSDKRRQDLFAQICPVLIENKREITKKNLMEAKEWWETIKRENWREGLTWFQVIKKVKGNPKFALLNEKECEKEYKNKK